MTALVSKNKPLFSYVGAINPQSIPFILVQIEDYLSRFYAIEGTKRKIMEVGLELLQNIYHHSTNHDSILPYFTIKKEKKQFQISGSNFIGKKDIQPLKNRIDYLNSLDKEALNTQYISVLKNGSLLGENAGLGLITIRRKSNNAILYKFALQDNNYYLFTVIVLV